MRYLLVAAAIPLATLGGSLAFVAPNSLRQTARATDRPANRVEDAAVAPSASTPDDPAAANAARQPRAIPSGRRESEGEPSSGARAGASRTDLSVADPFTYRVPKGTDGFVQSRAIEVPSGIRVLGILKLESGHSLAALQLPGNGDVYYVREGDDLQVDATARRNVVRSPSGGQPASTNKTPPSSSPSGVFYLKISKIADDCVEVYPENSPGNIHIFR